MDDDPEELAGRVRDGLVLAREDDEGELGGKEGPVPVVLSKSPGLSSPVLPREM